MCAIGASSPLNLNWSILRVHRTGGTAFPQGLPEPGLGDEAFPTDRYSAVLLGKALNRPDHRCFVVPGYAGIGARPLTPPVDIYGDQVSCLVERLIESNPRLAKNLPRHAITARDALDTGTPNPMPYMHIRGRADNSRYGVDSRGRIYTPAVGGSIPSTPTRSPWFPVARPPVSSGFPIVQ